MQINHRFSRRIGVTLLACAGLLSAAAHADPGKALDADVTTQLLDSTRQCDAAEQILTKLRFPTGTKFLLTDAGLVVVDQPRPARSRPGATAWEPEWPNSGN